MEPLQPPLAIYLLALQSATSQPSRSHVYSEAGNQMHDGRIALHLVNGTRIMVKQ